MSNKKVRSNKSVEPIREGAEVKGGLNNRPSTPRPSRQPQGQSPKNDSSPRK